MGNLFDGTAPTQTAQFQEASGLEVEAGTTGPRGGDAGHGSRSFLRLSDLGGTAWHIRVKDHSGEIHFIDSPSELEVALGGDTELSTFRNALAFAVSRLSLRIGLVFEPSDIVLKHEDGSYSVIPSLKEP